MSAWEQETRTTLATVGELDQAKLGAALKSWAVKAPESGNDITEPKPFKLMFQVAAICWRSALQTCAIRLLGGLLSVDRGCL